MHVALSLIGIASGFVVAGGLVTARRLDRWTFLFLTTTLATTVSGFAFPFHELALGHMVGALSLVALVAAIAARYARHLVGAWRAVYVIGALLALYLNVVILVVQAFSKLPALLALPPTQFGLLLVAAQIACASLFLLLAAIAVARFKVAPSAAPA